MDCIFCKIVSGELSSKLIYSDDLCVAFDDIEPQAPVHFLVIPKQHIASANDIDESTAPVIGHIFTVIRQIAEQRGLSDGYRIVNNCGADGGQSVGHLHFHVLGGTALSWPPYSKP